MAKTLRFRFDGDAKAAERVAKEIAAEFVVEVTKKTRDAIRTTITTALREGKTVVNTAREVKEIVSLTGAQSQAVMKFRDRLEESGLAPDKINKQVDRYAEKLLNDRAENIARTEVMGALNDGIELSWMQAQEEGLISETASKEVIVTPDDRLCPLCESMEGLRVPLGESFPEGDPPFHPQCRCTIAIVP